MLLNLWYLLLRFYILEIIVGLNILNWAKLVISWDWGF